MVQPGTIPARSRDNGNGFHGSRTRAFEEGGEEEAAVNTNAIDID